MSTWDDSDLLMTITGWFAVGVIVGVCIGLLLSYWALVREQKDAVCPYCGKRVYP